MSKSFTPQERRHAIRHDAIKYFLWVCFVVMGLVPPFTPIGILLGVTLIHHIVTE